LITREIHIGNLLLGRKNPVRIQSMTNTNTMDTRATAAQTMELAKAGCDMVRITARNKAEAENLRNIKSLLASRECRVPLIADIHFQPEAAEIAARIVEKVRINPGNFADKKPSGKEITVYSESQYQQELEHISLRLKPLLSICKEYGTAIRIGVNHGSLSARVTDRYGDTVEGMVASALEYIEICRFHDFQNLVLSMKSSDVKTMIYAYRLLVARMEERGFDYPLHLGVTEAGAGRDSRIKSAAGTGELLMEGIGDTIRVSLTENPVNEIPVAKALVAKFSPERKIPDYAPQFEYTNRETININGIGGENPPVCVFPEAALLQSPEFFPDFYLDIKSHCLKKPDNTEVVNFVWLTAAEWDEYLSSPKFAWNGAEVLMVDFSAEDHLNAFRKKLFTFKNSGNRIPLILYKKYAEPSSDLLLRASAEFSYFLTDGLAEGICVDTNGDKNLLPEMMFSLLQALGLRRIKAEFIACPTCGRTSYDVEGTLKKLSQKLSHLKHLKIGVMGCIVNGPGEMADADYGYVGAAAGKINLYRKKQVVLKNIDESQALDQLISLIKEDGRWTEPDPGSSQK